MQDGDLDNSTPPRILMLWEDTLASLPLENIRKEGKYIKRNHYMDAVRCWEIKLNTLDIIWDLWSRYDINVDIVVTTRPQEFANALNVIMHESLESPPIRYFGAMSITDLVRRINHMPDVRKIIFGREENRFTFGTKGTHLWSARSTADLLA